LGNRRAAWSVGAARAGITMKHGLAIGNRGATLISVTIDSLKAIYEESLEKQLPVIKWIQNMFDKFHEECGVVAVYGHPEAAKMAYLGLYALQHRGQESAGICTSDGVEIHCRKSMGHVADIFTTAGAGRTARQAGHRPHALLHRRRHGAAERAALFGGLQQRPRGGGAQWQHHQCHRIAHGAGAARLDLPGQ
jgi:hypothetical protein